MKLDPKKPIVCIGASLIDLNFRCEQEPILHTSNPAQLKRSAGGVVRNIAHHLGLLGLNVELLSVFGNDSDGEWLAKQCTDASVNLGNSLFTDHITGSYVSITSPAGELEIGAVTFESEHLLNIEFLQSRIHIIEKAAVVLADCNLSVESLKYLIRLCEQFSVPLIIETVSIPKAHRLKAALPGKLLLVKPNLDEFFVFDHDSDANLEMKLTQLHTLGFENIWLSLGSEGSLFYDGKMITKVPAPRVKVLDVSGAGDASVAGWIYAWMNGFDLLNCVLYGHAAAACLLEVKGAVRKDLSPELLLNYLK